MATTTFTYATQENFKDYFPHLVSMSDNKNPIYNWVSSGQANTYVAHNTGLVTGFYVDGAEQTLKQSDVTDVDSNGKWYYDTGLDALYYFNNAADPTNLVTESGSDYQNYMNNQLYRGSMELNNMLDSRYNTPVQKAFIHSTAPSSDDAEYDAIIIKMTCYLVAVNILRASGDYEQAELIFNEVSNTENTGMVDRLNLGHYKLSFETDSKDKSGDIIEVTNTGSMELVETYGEWTGHMYDRVQLICTTGGVYGTAKMTIKTRGTDKLYGQNITNWEVTGGLDHIGHGLYVRFEGNSMAVDDRWDIEVRNLSQHVSNSGVRTIDAIRNDLPTTRLKSRRGINI